MMLLKLMGSNELWGVMNDGDFSGRGCLENEVMEMGK
jgi:hypothetical protein